MVTLDDVLDAMSLRRVPQRMAACLRSRIVAAHPPYRSAPWPSQLRAWMRMLERYPEWTDDEWLLPDWALDELRMQEGLPI